MNKRQLILDVATDALQTEADALLRIKRDLGDEFVRAVESILECNGKVIMTGMGKSGLVAKKIAATLASTGTPSFYMHPGEAFHGDLGMISKGDIVIALSYSGETDEVLKIVPFIHDNGNTLISMTGNSNSSLAKNSDIHLDVRVEREACILHLAPTSIARNTWSRTERSASMISRVPALVVSRSLAWLSSCFGASGTSANCTGCACSSAVQAAWRSFRSR